MVIFNTMKALKQFILAKTERNTQKLKKASLGRVLQHTQSGQPFAILTPERSEFKNNPSQRMARTKAFEDDLKRLGYGYFKLLGHGQETDPVTNQVISVKEPSYFVPKMSLEHAKQLGQKYEQDAILHHNGQHTQLHWKGGGADNLGTFHPNHVGQYYSSVKGKPFLFKALGVDE